MDVMWKELCKGSKACKQPLHAVVILKLCSTDVPYLHYFKQVQLLVQSNLLRYKDIAVVESMQGLHRPCS